jgi:hypothetical protein
MAQDQGLQQVVRVLQEAQEQVLELAQEQARVLGLAAELVQVWVLAQAAELAQAVERVPVLAEVLAQQAEVLVPVQVAEQARQGLVQAEERAEVLEPGWAQGPLVEL